MDFDTKMKILYCMKDGTENADSIMFKFKIDRETYDEIERERKKMYTF